MPKIGTSSTRSKQFFKAWMPAFPPYQMLLKRSSQVAYLRKKRYKDF